MTDRIEVRGLLVHACHGVLECEKQIPQPFVIDISLTVDLLPAGCSDRLEDSLSYADVAQRALEVCSGEPVELIETLAERVAAAAFAWDVVEAATVTVHKPQAPAGVPFTGTPGSGPSVRVTRERSRQVVVALGTNLGRRVATLRSAVQALRELDGFRVVHVSPLVETDPVGGIDQPDYLNAVVVGVTRMAGKHLLRELHRIEEWHGRRREVRWGARTLDLDLIQLGTPGEADEVRCGDANAAAVDAHSSSLALPHPRAAERGFVLVPWHSAAPWARVRVGESVLSIDDVVRRVDVAGVRPGPSWESDETMPGCEPRRPTSWGGNE